MVTTTVTSTTVPVRAAVETLESGLLCRDLVALGYDYGDAVVYWESEGAPDRMDADRNGVPCQTVYPAETVVEVWGEPLPEAPYNTFATIEEWDAGPPATLVADYSQWFFGDEAVSACIEDRSVEYPDEDPELVRISCETSMHHVRNVNPRLRTLLIADDALVIVLNAYPWTRDRGIGCVEATPQRRAEAGLEDHPTRGCLLDIPMVEAFDNYYAHYAGRDEPSQPNRTPVGWIAVDNGVVTAYEEQYTP